MFVAIKTGVAEGKYTIYTFNTENQIYHYYFKTIISIRLNA
jgi:hypothetical protein